MGRRAYAQSPLSRKQISHRHTQQEEKNQAPVANATTVKLLCQLPPIEKMDAALSQISHVE